MRASVFPGEDPMTLDTPEQAAEFIVPMCAPDWTETGKFYDYKTRTLMSFQRAGVNAFSVIASATKQSSFAAVGWIASLRSQ